MWPQNLKKISYDSSKIVGTREIVAEKALVFYTVGTVRIYDLELNVDVKI